MAVISINMLLICFRYLLTEIGARDLGDPHRFNMLEVRHDILINLARSIDRLQRGNNLYSRYRVQ